MGKFWARWGDVVSEAGIAPNELQGRFWDKYILEKYALFVREIQKIPVAAELKLKTRQDKSFPSHNVFGCFGGKQAMIEKLIEFCESAEGLDEVLAIALPQF